MKFDKFFCENENTYWIDTNDVALCAKFIDIVYKLGLRFTLYTGAGNPKYKILINTTKENFELLKSMDTVSIAIKDSDYDCAIERLVPGLETLIIRTNYKLLADIVEQLAQNAYVRYDKDYVFGVGFKYILHGDDANVLYKNLKDVLKLINVKCG